VSSFPARLAECKRLRYLNARFNKFPEFPKPILQLTSLEILDLARNDLRSIPDGVRNLKNLKVLALQRNKIDRLPVFLGEMSRLVMLKVEENPLEFPPYEICVGANRRTVSPAEVIEVTKRMKEYLVKNAKNASNTAKADSDDEMRLVYPSTLSPNLTICSDQNAETPRPVRPVGRFPVRPSLSGSDSINGPSTSTSPDPPPVPNRSHERMKSVQNAPPRKQYLLSPPTTTGPTSSMDSGSEMNVRTKRHGIITPRGPEGAPQSFPLSPSALQDAFSNVGSRPPSRAGSGVSSASLSAESILECATLVCKVLTALSKQASDMRQSMDIQNTLRQHIEMELRSGSSRCESLVRALRRAQSMLGQQNASRPGFLLRPIVDCLASISQFARLLSQNTPLFCRAVDHERYRGMFWDIQKEGWELFIANNRMSTAVKSVNHSRQTSSSSQFRLPYHSSDSSRSGPMTSIFDPRLARNAPTPSPMLDNTLGPAFGSSSSFGTSFGNQFSSAKPAPYSRPVHILGPDGNYVLREEDARAEMSYDHIWDTVYVSLRDLCDKVNDALPRIQMFFNNERQKTVRSADADSEMARHLASLIGRGNATLDSAQLLNRRLDNLRVNDRTIRHDVEFWQLCWNTIMVCSRLCSITLQMNHH
jgi:hypothetical protein